MRRSAVLFASLLLVGGCSAPSLWAQANPAVTVDFGTPVPNVRSESGLLSFPSPRDAPFNVVVPLQPRFWSIYPSGNIPVFSQAQQHWSVLAIQTAMRLDLPKGQAPYSNWSDWESFVQQAAQATKGQNVIYLPWNEPDLPGGSWTGTQAQFFELYLRTYKVIRQILGPDVPIRGPSIWHYDKVYLTAFLDYCKANGCEVNVLDWHELGAVDAGVPAITGHLTDARASFLSNSSYASLKIRQIHIGEIIDPIAKHQPGGILAYLYYTETGGADGASKACWPDSTGATECGSSTLDGLITPLTFQPRAGWWAYKTYVDGVGTRVSSTITDPHIVSLASAGSVAAGTAQVLLGHLVEGDVPRTAVTVNVTLKNLNKLSFLANATIAHLRFERIPNTDEAALLQMLPANESDLQIQAGSAQTTIADFNPGDAYRITISAVPSGLASSVAAVVNAASFTANAAPGSLISIFGSNLAAQKDAASSVPWPTSMDGLTVIVNDIPAPLIAMDPDQKQINAQLPFEIISGSATLTVRTPFNLSAPYTFNVLANSAEVFEYGTNRAIVINQDGSLNSPASPAPVGSVVVAYLTGPGTLDNYVATGQAAPGSPLSRAAAKYSATISGVNAPIDFLGLSPGSVGLLQANLHVPSVGAGDQPLVFTVGGVVSKPALIAIAAQ